MQFLHSLAKTLTSYFAFWIALISVVSFLYPYPFSGLDYLIVPVLGLIMLGMGMTLKIGDFRRIIRKPKGMLTGIICQYTAMPLAGFMLAWVFELDPMIAAGIVLVGSCPGGTASNVITFLSRGNLALSVTMTVFTTLLSPLAIPLMMYVYANQWIEVPAGALFLSTLYIVLFPLIAGLMISRLIRNINYLTEPLLPALSSVGIIFIVAVIISLNTDTLKLVGPILFIVIIIHNLIGLCTGYIAARLTGLSKPDARAISIEIGMQNSGLGVALATANLTPLAALPSAIFSIWHNLSGSLLAFVWSKSKDPRKGGCI